MLPPSGPGKIGLQALIDKKGGNNSGTQMKKTAEFTGEIFITESQGLCLLEWETIVIVRGRGSKYKVKGK